MAYIYLASPYSHADPAIREQRYRAALNCTVQLLTRRIWAYSPIIHCHELAKLYDLPHDAKFWADYDFEMLREAMSLHILTLDGWQESSGVAREIEWATKLKLPIFKIILSPATLVPEITHNDR